MDKTAEQLLEEKHEVCSSLRLYSPTVFDFSIVFNNAYNAKLSSYIFYYTYNHSIQIFVKTKTRMCDWYWWSIYIDDYTNRYFHQTKSWRNHISYCRRAHPNTYRSPRMGKLRTSDMVSNWHLHFGKPVYGTPAGAFVVFAPVTIEGHAPDRFPERACVKIWEFSFVTLHNSEESQKL